MTDFSWRPAFAAIVEWIHGYESKQPELAQVLKDIGVTSGLVDQDYPGHEIPLLVMDPFTFLAQINKYGVEKRKELIANLINHQALNVAAPEDFNGVPSANQQKAWMFGFAHGRKDGDIETLWAIFKAAVTGGVQSDLFSRGLKVRNTGYTKLTQALFWVAPDQYFPIDSQTKPWMHVNGIVAPKDDSWEEYLRCLDDIRASHSEPFYELSYEAWKANQAPSVAVSRFNAQIADDYLNRRFPKTRTYTTHLVAFRCENGRQLAFDPGVNPDRKQQIKVFVDEIFPEAQAEGRIEHYPGNRKRHHHLKGHAPELAEGHEAWAITIGSIEQLQRLVDWYAGSVKSAEAIKPFTETQESTNVKQQPLNQILFGPPGTGKTYVTTELAVQIADPEWYRMNSSSATEGPERESLKDRYDELVSLERIAFTTFHQSFAYEDFVEGIRAVSDKDTGALRYPVVDGVFKRMVDDANKATGSGKEIGVSETPRIWKVSIDRGAKSPTREFCFDHGEARIGWNETGDLNIALEDRSDEEQEYWLEELSNNNRTAITNFAEMMQVGDVILCRGSQTSVQAVGVVRSDYFFDPEAKESRYAHCRKVEWLLKGIDLDILALNDNTRLTQQTVYPLDRFSWDDLLKLAQDKGLEISVGTGEKPNYVLIIDEINRGNIARIFGELITLLEPGKRRGAHDARVVTLPYSKKPFSVPSNLYVIGTMNTADKSLAQIDLALRRRFSFVEIPPDSALLSGIEVHGVNVGRLLDAINERIEVLLDRDHLIGHSYFFGLRNLEGENSRRLELARVFRENIIPLLQEYFFDDHERIGWVLNDPAKNQGDRFVQQGMGRAISDLFTAESVDQITDRRFRINAGAFDNPNSYKGIVGTIASPVNDDQNAG